MSNVDYREKRLAPFKHLWRVDDELWMEQRNKDWLILEEDVYKNLPKIEIETYKKYFLFGIRCEYIPENTIFLLTPIVSSKDAYEFFMSENFSAQTRQDVMSRFFRLSYLAQRLPWYRDHVKYFCEGVLGHKYQELEMFEGTRMEIYSPSPTHWCKDFCSFGIKVLQGEIPYYGAVDSVDYFVSALAHADKQKFRKWIKLKELLEVVDDVLSKESTSEIAKEFAQNLKEKEEQIKSNWALNAHLDA